MNGGPCRSAIYEGHVEHWRHRPVEHRFRLGLFMVYLDLDELPALFDGTPLWSARRPAPAWFRRSDYMPHTRGSLAAAVREEARRQLRDVPPGPVRMLTHLRTFGHAFNPATVYYLFEEDGDTLGAAMVEITNTPWKERHCYAIRPGVVPAFQKEFHVSPFMPMDQEYHWSVEAPGEELVLRMENHERGDKVFEAGLRLRRREIRPSALNALLVRHPLMTLRVVAGIHWHAFRLWRKRVPFHSHPRKRMEEGRA